MRRLDGLRQFREAPFFVMAHGDWLKLISMGFLQVQHQVSSFFPIFLNVFGI